MARKNNLFLGMILGIALGLAFAPKKGSELRKELANDFKEGGHGEGILQENASIISKDFVKAAKQVYANPQVQEHLQKGKKEAKKILKFARKNIEENSSEWVELAREKLLQVKEQVEKSGSEIVSKLNKEASSKSKSEHKKN